MLSGKVKKTCKIRRKVDISRTNLFYLFFFLLQKELYHCSPTLLLLEAVDSEVSFERLFILDLGGMNKSRHLAGIEIGMLWGGRKKNLTF